jgi:hypothetical protein
MSHSVPLFLVLLLALPSAVFAAPKPASPVGKPATSIPIADVQAHHVGGERKWFASAESFTDLSFKGMKAIGVGFGRQFDHFFLDLRYRYIAAPADSIKIHQQGVTAGTPLEKNAEFARDRGADTQSMHLIGPGIGTHFRLFKSETFIEMARFGINYARYHDSRGNNDFHGGVANFQAALGIVMGNFILAPGFSWNLGAVQRTTNNFPSNDERVKHRYLPIQWWAAEVNAYLWLF